MRNPAAICFLLALLAAREITLPSATCQAAEPASAKSAEGKSDESQRKYETIRIRGRVVYLADALSRQFGIKTVPEVAERELALETAQGKIYPLVEDLRGRSFRRDARLRKHQVELLVRRYEGSPVVQVIQIFAVQPEGLYELDYWCEICAIAMYELKECDCCQGPIELRERLVEK
jgi:hypothetical protein